MWSVALRNTMLTYFEIDPGSCFNRHAHRSEQITLVLKGELFFQIDGQTVCLGKGEALAIPSNIFHRAYTGDSSVIAVDAWSPVRAEYRREGRDEGSKTVESILAGCPGMKP
jgi:quercetin dioxygenase-like cupin family protein